MELNTTFSPRLRILNWGPWASLFLRRRSTWRLFWFQAPIPEADRIAPGLHGSLSSCRHCLILSLFPSASGLHYIIVNGPLKKGPMAISASIVWMTPSKRALWHDVTYITFSLEAHWSALHHITILCMTPSKRALWQFGTLSPLCEWPPQKGPNGKRT